MSEQKLRKDNGISIDPRDRCDPSLDDSAFLKTLLIDTASTETTFDTIDWQNGRVAISITTGFGQLDKCLTIVDIAFMLQQKKDRLNFKWDNSKLKFDIENDSHWYAFSIPLFSKDRSKAVLMIKDLCPGLCGTGWTLLYKKENNKWKSQTGGTWWH